MNDSQHVAAHAPTDFAVTGTREAILRTVVEYPFDDLPRTIFLDWMEENGRPEKASGTRHHPGRCPTDHFWTCTTKRFLASAAGMFARRPITSVRLTDKRAWNDSPMPTNTRYPYYWYAADGGWASLPLSIFLRLAGGYASSEPATLRASYPTNDAANAALSRTCVDYGRELAGLRAIDWDTETNTPTQ